MNDLKELLGEVAEQAKAYQVARPALAAARRRRFLLHVAPAAVVAAVAVAVAAAWVPLHRGTDPPARTRPEAYAWLPDEVRMPATKPPPLPTDRGVGRGALVHGWCEQICYLVTEDGRQYVLRGSGSELDQGPWSASVTLSPDGRWIGYLRTKDEYVVRDLTGTTVFRVPAVQANKFPGMRPDSRYTDQAWSPDSRWLALVPENAMHGSPVVVLDLRTGKTRTVWVTSEIPGFDLSGVLPSGELLLSSGAPDATLDLHVIDPGTGLQRRRVSRDLSTALAAGEALNSIVRVAPDGRTAFVEVIVQLRDGKLNDMTFSDVIQVDLRDGTPVGRHRMPPPRLAPSTDPPNNTPTPKGPDGRGAAEYRYLLTVRSGAVLLAHHNGSTVAFERLDLATGQRTVVCRLPAGTTGYVTRA